ncbi:UvrD-helicase domain-containing protein [Holdemanella sp.]|uniref:UvrD-helicase domain-containing protein n=1 Tax=Holdemanella sp. TaxID=1971762 RepID=UPI003080597B
MVAEKLVQENDELYEILEHIKQGHNFLLSGGAGSGKTYSLVQVLQHISGQYPNAQIACVTYTNAAAIEIKNRANIKNLRVSTIHDFLWDMIVQFQKEAKITLLELINNPECSIKNPNSDSPYQNTFENGIQYKEYLRIDRGEISHDEVLVLANGMFKKYPRLCDLLIDKFQFIFVDEYQDTSPLVIEILLEFIQQRKKKNIIGFFGDAMQSIYETGIGDIDSYIKSGVVFKVEKKQNRRNPQTVIDIANKIRTDGLVQTSSKDFSAPNMENGIIKQGSVKFLYSTNFDLDKVKMSSWVNGWDFHDAKKTKELRLTHNLIADEAGFSNLMAVYDNDPIAKFKEAFLNEAKKQDHVFSDEDSFDTVVKSMPWVYKRGLQKGKSHLEVLLEDSTVKVLYEHIKDWPYSKVKKIYLNKDNLIDDKVAIDDVTIRDPKRDCLMQHLFKIQDLISLFENKEYNELIRRTSFSVQSIADKANLKKCMDDLKAKASESIEAVISYADSFKLCIADDKLKDFINNNDYLYWRIKDIPFKEFQNLYLYLEGHTPFSTQHKIKGLEFDNVLIVLHNGGWNNYNFEYLFDDEIEDTLNPSQKKSYPRILHRTKKLFYVCCTRAKENLIVYYPSPSPNVLEGAITLFGIENCVNLDTD